MKYTEYNIKMKKYYENRAKISLIRGVPVIIRIDGKCFSRFCNRFIKPYDQFFNDTLNQVMSRLCENIQGAKLAERHSDEISILLTDFDTIRTDAYFDYSVQKICSIVASMATAEFCKRLMIDKYIKDNENSYLDFSEPWPSFDARCFNLPMHELSNYFWWRMNDAKRNSISMLAQSYFSHKQLQGKTSNEMQEMIWQEKQINWAKLPQGQKIGFLCIKVPVLKQIIKGPKKGESVNSSNWEIYDSPSSKAELNGTFDEIAFKKEK